MNQRTRSRVRALLVVAVCWVGVWAASSQREDEQAVDSDVYAAFMSAQVSDIHGLEQFFFDQQDVFLPIVPPDPDFTLRQTASQALPFDPKSFPAEFVESLTLEYENSVPVYPVTILEDPISRETVFLNVDGKKIYSLPPVTGYDPFVYLKWLMPGLYSGAYSPDEVYLWQKLYDPARVQVSVKLLPLEYVEPYLYAQAKIAEAAAEEAEKSGGGGEMLLMGSEETSLVYFVRFTNYIRAGNSTLKMYLRCETPTNLTNTVALDIFSCTNLPPFGWNVEATNLSGTIVTGATRIYDFTWTDTNAYPNGLHNRAYTYGAGDSFWERDGDGLTDAREFFLYHTDYSTNDTDGDGLVDGYSGVVPTNIYPGGVATGAYGYVEGELSWGTLGYVADSDGDGLSDGIEVLNGTSPTNGNWPPNVSGIIYYSGRQTGSIWVVAVTNSDSWSTNGGITLSVSGIYQIPSLYQTSYYVKTFRDSDSSGTMNATEAQGTNVWNPLVITAKVANINITLTDPDADSDSLPDWWELRYWTSVTVTAWSNDPDADDYSNLEEYQADTVPTNSGSHPHNIEGLISYAGPQTGTFYIIASTTETSWVAAGYDTLATTGAYAITHLASNKTYWTKAYRDSNGNTNRDFGEAWGSYGSSIYLTNNTTNVDITLTDPDTDGDTVPDWWEVHYGLDPSNGGVEDVVGWWKLDENSGSNVLDSSSYTNSGTLSFSELAPACWTDGAISNAISLNGTNAYVQLTNSASLNPNLVSVLLWIRPAQDYTKEDVVFFSKRDASTDKGYELGYTNGCLAFRIYSSGAKNISLPCSLYSGTWYHVAGVFDGTLQQLYTNGCLAAQTNWSLGGSGPPPLGGSLSNSDINPRIGASTDATPTNFFFGKIDDVRVYQIGLLSEQVFGIYQLGMDLDGDGLGSWDEYHWGSDPTSPDTDNDSMPDWWELQYFGGPTNAQALGDEDSDGLENHEEYYFSYSPTNSERFLYHSTWKTVVVNTNDPAGADDGTERFDFYGLGRPLSLASNASDDSWWGVYGDASSGGIYFNNDGSNLYIGISGLDRENANCFIMFIDSGSGGVTNLAHLEGQPVALGTANNIGFDSVQFTPNVAILMGNNAIDGSNSPAASILGNEFGQGVYALSNSATIGDFPGFNRTNGGAASSQWLTNGAAAGATPRGGVEVALPLANLGVSPGQVIKAACILVGGTNGVNRWVAPEAYGKSVAGNAFDPVTLIGAEVQLAGGTQSMPTNGYPGFTDSDVMFQAFFWNCDSPGKNGALPGTGGWYTNVLTKVSDLATSGFTKVYLPPPQKGQGGLWSMGYDPYDHYDLGHYYQQDTTNTRFGSYADLTNLNVHFLSVGIQPIADTVMNHMRQSNTTSRIFSYPHGIFEKGTNDFHPSLLGNNDELLPYHRTTDFGSDYFDVDQLAPHMRDGLKTWGEWLVTNVQFRGFRFDLTQRIEPWYLTEFSDHPGQRGLFACAEYWRLASTRELQEWVNLMGRRVAVWDWGLRDLLYQMCYTNAYNFDVSSLTNALFWVEPDFAINYVENHDTYCPDKTAEPEITRRGAIRNKELAYALVLFAPGLPSVYWLDYYDTPYHDGRTTNPYLGYSGSPLKPTIDRLVFLRTNLLSGGITYLVTNDSTKADLFVAERAGSGAKQGAIFALNDSDSLSISNWVKTRWTNAVLRDWMPTSSFVTATTDTNGFAWIGATQRSFRVFAPTNAL